MQDFFDKTEHTTSKDRMFFSYDLQGNLIEETGAGNRRYSYNSFNQQIKIEDHYGYVQEHRYDGEGLRAGITSKEDSSHFVFYNGELLTESGSGETFRSRYILGYGVAANEVEEQSGYHAYHLDEQNSTAYITGSHGQVENAYAYDSFGNLRRESGELRNRILYTGQQYDQEMGQYYLRARYYNPAIGRFTQEDVYRGDGLNLYAYCANNPVVYYDPSGYDEKCIGEGEEQDSQTVKEGSGQDSVGNKKPETKPTKNTGADTLPDNIVQRGVTPAESSSIEAGNGIQKPTPAHKTTPTQHVGGTQHSRDPYTSTTRSSDTANYYASHDGDGMPLNKSNPVVTIDLNKIDPSNIVDVSTTDKAKGTLKTPFTQNAAAADQEVLIKGDIPPEAIIGYKK